MNITLDLRGLKCPLPALRTRKALAALTSGDTATIECTDPLASIDIPHLVAQCGDVIEQRLQRGDVLVFRIRKS
jgi:tRNA 2-thiouridine synthesizing protein A